MAGLEGAHADEGYANTGGPKDGPVLTMMSKRLRGLRKKYNRILQIEESKAQGKTVNKEQEDVLKTKIAIAALIDEYEKLRQPLLLAVKEETILREYEQYSSSGTTTTAAAAESAWLQQKVERRFSDGDVAELLKLLYFAHLFDVRSQADAPSLVWTKVHERSSCLSYDFVTDDATTPLIEGDLDMLSFFGSMLTSRPPNVTLSHRDALQRCIEHAHNWLLSLDRDIHSDAQISYLHLRERLNRILSSEYFTMTPELQTVSQQTAAAAAAAATAAGQYLTSKELDHNDGPAAYYAQPEQHQPAGTQMYEYRMVGTNRAVPSSNPNPYPLETSGSQAFKMPQFGSHEETYIGNPDDAEEEQQQSVEQPDAAATAAAGGGVGDSQPQPPAQSHHQHYAHHAHHPQVQMGGAPRSAGGGYQQGHPGAGAPARGGRGMPGGYQGTGARAAGRGGYPGRSNRGGRGGMYTNGGRNAQFYDQSGSFHPQPNHYGGRGGRGGGGGRGGSGMMYNGHANGVAAPSTPAAPAVATGSA
ncbi:unnamed protein product [Sphagnum jensenii]|uniref:Uncharacterized protein n=1 Tax=Sphagnum jensenii TaxID=128206 RepID=A0ABP1C3G4_9BRYO